VRVDRGDARLIGVQSQPDVREPTTDRLAHPAIAFAAPPAASGLPQRGRGWIPSRTFCALKNCSQEGRSQERQQFGVSGGAGPVVLMLAGVTRENG
jgi:hypothetical protein